MYHNKKRFIAEHDSWKKKKDLENIKEVVVEYEGIMNTEVKRQEKLDMAEERNFRRGKLLVKYMVKMLCVYHYRKFKDNYLKKLKKN